MTSKQQYEMEDKIGLYLLTLCGQLCHPLGGLALCDTRGPGEVWGPGHDVISCHYVWTERCYIYTCRQKLAPSWQAPGHWTLCNSSDLGTKCLLTPELRVWGCSHHRVFRLWTLPTHCLGVWSIYGLIIIQLRPYYMLKFM